MELALYHPGHGYYEGNSTRVGKPGDFFTSVSVGCLFGELLAFQFSEWLGAAGAPAPGQIVEAGAHAGQLAADILGWFRAWRPECFARLEYWIIEPSPRRQAWQELTLREFSGHVHWLPGLSAFPDPSSAPGIKGIIFANELLDAFPVHRLGWDAGARRWFEWGVRSEGDRFIWTRLPIAAQPHVAEPGFQAAFAPLEQLPPALLSVLPDGFTTEIAPRATTWWEQAAARLQQGRLLTIDYGLSAEQFFAPQRADGTLRTYHRHQAGPDLLAQPGEQDLTAHVNFTALAAAGVAAGLDSPALQSQAQFLTRIAEQSWPPAARFGEWTPARTREFQTLTHPEHLGRPFQVLVQSRP